MYKLTTDEPEGKAPEIIQALDELAREGARRMIVEALELEVEEHVHALRHLRDEQGHALVVRNGKSHHERTVQLGAGSIQIRAPRVHIRVPSPAFPTSRSPYAGGSSVLRFQVLHAFRGLRSR
jgi:transposase-like protein